VCSACRSLAAQVFLTRTTIALPVEKSGEHRLFELALEMQHYPTPKERPMNDTFSVLIVDDDEASREYLGALLDALGFTAEAAAGGVAALERLSQKPPPDVIVLDVIMPELDGVETLRRYRGGGGRAPVVMCSAIDEADTVVRAMRAGAQDYITKPFNTEELREILERVAGDGARPRATTVREAARPAIGATHLGASPPMRRVDELIDRIADADVPVLITGESGVGKDVVAREVHARSARASKIFVKINCAALPGELLESELFGHERGSFTGAQKTKPGQFELADGGTLFLDEIGEMPVAMQAKLLQALQDGEFYRVGGQKKIKVDTRVIVATNVDLAKAMERGTFREDLYYRLNVVEVAIPPLRERREDIPRLLEHFVDKYGKRYGRTMSEVPTEIVERFLTYEFPGNIRELENLVRRLIVLRDPRYVLSELRDRTVENAAPPGAIGNGNANGMAGPERSIAPPTPLGPSSPTPLPPPLYGSYGTTAAYASPFNSPSPLPPPIIPPPPPSTAFRGAQAIADAAGAQVAAEEIVDDYRIDLKDLGRKAAHAAEREAIIIMLGHTGGNKREAAERLGISYKAILYKIREFGIGRPRGPRKPLAPARTSAPPTSDSTTLAAAAGANRDGDGEADRAVIVETSPDTWTD
jgi:DNA-binding NtrC family response regulator